MTILFTLNWLGLIIGAVLAFALGAFWFSPAGFGKIWMSALGKSEEQLGKMLPPMLVQAGFTLLLAVFIALLYVASLPNCELFAMLVGALMLVQFISNYSDAMFENNDRRLPCITGGYNSIMTVIIALSIHLTTIYF